MMPKTANTHRLSKSILILFVSSIHLGVLFGSGLLSTQAPIIESGGGDLSYFSLMVAGENQQGEQVESASAAASLAAPPESTANETTRHETVAMKTSQVNTPAADFKKTLPTPVRAKPEPKPKPKPIAKPKPTPPTKPKNLAQNKPVNHPAVTNTQSKTEGHSTFASSQTQGAGAGVGSSTGRAGAGGGGGAAGASTGVGFAQGSGNCTKPDYPQESIIRNETGTTRIRFVVEANGVVSSVTIAKSSGSSRLDQAALEKASSCRFTPAKRAGLAIKKTVIVPYRFNLNP